MVLGLDEEVSWCSVSSVIEDWERNPFGDVKDRSLSYLDIHFREQFYCGKSKVFESVRKFGRPRQQISEFLSFTIDGAQEQKSSDLGKRYHFGQCLILPKVSTLPPKGNVNRRKSAGHRTLETRKRLSGNEDTVMFVRPLGTVHRSGDRDIEEFENKMYRWSETLPDNYSKRSLRKSSIEEVEDASLRSGGITGNKKEFSDYYEEDHEDIEAQIDVRYRKDVGSNQDDYYYHNTLEARPSRHLRDVDEITNPETRISDIRENWKLKVLKEMEAKQMKGKPNVDLSKHRSKENLKDDIPWEKSSERRTWVEEEEEVEDKRKKELHRSKSTPDMLEGITKRKLEVWPTEDKPKKNGSMMEVYPRHWSVYNDQQEADSLNEPNSLQEPVSSPEYPGVGGKSRNSRFATGKGFFGQFLNSGGTTPTPEMFTSEPFSQFWVTLSNVYGQALVILMLAFSLTEVMDNSVKLLSLQGIFLMYLYVGSIAVIICIYIWVLIDSCSSMQTNDGTGLVPPTITTSVVPDRDSDLRNLSPTKFGSLKKAHITRDRTSSTSFYLRIGAIAFGLGTLVFNGLEMAMHSMMEGSCLNDVVFVHPILQGLFTFLQMHFLFVNSQVLVERFGLAARFGFMHLAATNLALWIRLVIWESGNEWTYYVHLSQTPGNGPSSEVPTPLQLRGFPKYIVRREREVDYGQVDNSFYRAVSTDHISQVVSLHQCLNTNSLGQLWTSSMPFLYPFLIQFSLIAAAVTYIMGQNVAKDRLFFQKQKKVSDSKSSSLPTLPDNINVWGIDCSGASKGLFLGILCLVAGVVVIIIFLVVKENEDFPPETIFWLTSGTLITILSITIIMNVVGLIQIRKLSVIGTKMTPLDKILSVVSMLGVQLFTILGIVVGGSGIGTEEESSVQKRHGMLLAVSIIQLIQALLQSSFVVEGIRRTCLSRTQAITKPARQVITFLIFSNAVLWAFDTFVVQSWISQELQLRFFGILAWGVISRIGLPLFVFFRFHSCVLLLEIWKRSYHSLHLDPGN